MAQSRPLNSPSLTREDFIDFSGFHARKESVLLERSLDTFLKVYEGRRVQFNEHIKHAVNDSSKNFLLAIRFLRHFKAHNRQLYNTNPDDRRLLRSEVLGLMASILQVIMNAKKVTENKQKRLRDIFLGDKIRGCLKESELEKNDHFVYNFPKLFIRGENIQGNWFTKENAEKELAGFSSSDIQADFNEFVTGCFVHLYDKDLAANYSTAEYKIAVEKLQKNLSQESNETAKQETVSDEPRRKRKRGHRK